MSSAKPSVSWSCLAQASSDLQTTGSSRWASELKKGFSAKSQVLENPGKSDEIYPYLDAQRRDPSVLMFGLDMNQANKMLGLAGLLEPEHDPK